MRARNLASLTDTELAEIESQLSGHQTLSDVLKWAYTQPPAKLAANIITGVLVQDEFTHDVLIPWGDRLVLVYGTT